MSPGLDIRLFGGFHISFDGKPVPGMHSMRLQTLLAYLVLNRGSQVSRQYLSFCFWPDSSESNARSNLRQQLHKLRKILPDHDTYLQIENQTVSWNPEVPVSLDIAEFEQTVNKSKKSAGDDSKQFNVTSLENAVEIYRGDLFPECYEEWIESARSQFREDYMAILDKLVEHFESHRVHGKAIYYAEKLLDCDKLREKTHLDLMRLHALSRERANSLKVYRNYVELLDQELGIEPGSDIKQLHRQLVENDQIAGYGSGNGKTEEEDLLPMIGRQKEWVRLRETWKNVLGGESHFVIISGEAGIGKTRLARELYQTVSRQNYMTTSAHCYEAEGSLSYSPVNEWLSSENIKHRLKELDKVYLREITRLLPELLSEIPALSPPAPITDKWQQHHFFESLARSVILPKKPMLMLIDDLQWCDRETLEWIHFLLRFASDQPLLVVGTVRVEEVDEAHPLRLIVKSLHKTDRVTEINLQPLSPYETGMLAEQVYGDDMTEALRNQLFRETEGNPLFLVESIHAIISDKESTADESLDNLIQSIFTHRDQGLMPDRVQSVIRSRFEMVSPEARRVGNYAAAIGRNFGIGLLHRSSHLSREKLVPLLDELVKRRIFREQGDGKYDFSHDKFREVSYSLMNSADRRMVHENIATALEEIHQENIDSASSQIAFHYDHAGRVDKAIQFYKQAAKEAQLVYALEEALRLLRRGLGLLQSLPVNKNREQNELEMRLTLGPMLASLNGYHAPDVQENNNHIRKLSSRLDQAVHTPVLRSMAISSVVQGDLDEVYKLGKQILKGPVKEKKSVIESEGHYVAGVSSFWQGKFDLARNHFNDAIDSYDPRNEQIHIDYYAQQPKIVCQIRLALTYLYLGFPEQAGQWFRCALDDARKCNHPFSLAYALYYGAVIKSELGEVDTAAKLADECVTLTDKRGYNLWYLIAFVFQSRIHFQKDGDLNKIEEFQNRLDQMRSAGIRLKSPFYASHLARTRLITGNMEAALEAADYALDLVNERGESWYLAEIYRTRGNILYIIGDDPAETEKWLQKANSVAGKQNARLFQLRAVRDLANLWHDQNKTLKALQELRKIYGQFTEGLETPDLKDAAGLIEKLS